MLRKSYWLLAVVALSGLVLSFTLDSDDPGNTTVEEAATTVAGQDDEMPASVDEVIKWKTYVQQNGCDATLVVEVTQIDGWHIYSQTLPDGAVNFPTVLDFKKVNGVKFVGKTSEPPSHVEDNEGFPERPLHGEKIVFKQKVKVTDGKAHDIKLELEFMACKKACFRPEIKEFSFSLTGCTPSDDEGETDPEDDPEIDTVAIDSIVIDSLTADVGAFEGPITFSMVAYRIGAKKYEVDLAATPDKGWILVWEGKGYDPFSLGLGEQEGWKMSGDLKIFSGDKKIKPKDFDGVLGFDTTIHLKQNVVVDDTMDLPLLVADIDFQAFKGDSIVRTTGEGSTGSFALNRAIDNRNEEPVYTFLALFIIAFGSGLIALLTPCVFPMIPMTVTFFTKQSKTKAEGIRKAIIYSISIIVIYLIMGVGFAKILGADGLNALSTGAVPNIFFFILFVVFALSFFGAFEIQLPTSWINKADKGADKGGLIGIFFMAFTLALVSFSCTGPVVGTVLVQSAAGGVTGPIVAMLGFSLALALPFGLFAAFPGWLNSLPQSGGWLNSVKVVLAFLELAFALKFLSTADMAYQWHLLDREVYVALWIAIFTCMGFYLMGWIRFSHDSEVTTISTTRGILAIITFAFVFYLIPGLWNNAELKLVNAYLPPPNYAENSVEHEEPEEQKAAHGTSDSLHVKRPETSKHHGHGIYTDRDYQSALAYARKVGKPLMIDFTGWACVNCRKMEQNVWIANNVIDFMRDSVVIASLYVDEKTDLPKSEQYYSKVLDKDVTTVGTKYMELSIGKYGEATQPLYVLVDHNENMLTGKANYETHSNPEDFEKWLRDGLKNFRVIQSIEEFRPEVELVADDR